MSDARRHRLLIIAHRGASAVAPEGTAAAIRAAAHAGAGMVELDVQMTRDDRLVVFHDATLERTTTGSGRLTRHRYAEIARLDAGSWFHPRFASERILLLSHALRLAPATMQINVELKGTERRTLLLARLQRLVRRLGVARRLLVSSFDPALLAPQTAPAAARALICRRAAAQSLQRAIRLGCVAWHPHHTVLTPARVAQAHAAGLRVHAWTVDDRRLARTLISWGVDGVFTNDPARLRRLR